MAARNWRMYARLDAMRDGVAIVKERLAGVEAKLALLVKGLRIEIRETEQ